MSSSPNRPVAISRAPHGVPAARACTGSPPPGCSSRNPRPGGVVLIIAAAELIRGLSPRRYSTLQVSGYNTVLVRPGERVGADGLVVGSSSDVDQATITGEALPVPKQAGDEVFAGTMNGGALRVRVSRPADESAIARIVALVEQASASKARLQLFIERVEQRYSAVMVAATVLLFAVPLAFGGPLRPTLLRAMTFMIVASPCAVVLATMPPLLAAIANAGRHGILVKSAVVMELLGRADTVAFDKTGTLTEGAPAVVGVRALPGAADDDRVLSWAAAAEQNSEHPLGRAVVSAACDRGLAVPPAAGFSSAPGWGVTARVGAHQVQVGSPRLLAGLGADQAPDRAGRLVQQAQREGHTAVVVLVDRAPAGVITLADRLRPDAAAAVQSLTLLTSRAPALLTGDGPAAADRVAAAVGISHVHAGLLPADKAERVRRMQAKGRRVLLVGDGVNDAPAMATADLGLAMGRRGSDLALRTADAVTVRDELAGLPVVIAMSRRARRLVTANLVIAATVITTLVAWDLIDTLPLPLGVAGHEGSTVIVGLNGMRLLRRSAWRSPAPRGAAAGGARWRRGARSPAALPAVAGEHRAASSRSFAPISLSAKNVCATGAESASPVVSTRMRSNRSRWRIRAPRMRIRSPRTVQQIQPLFISKISSWRTGPERRPRRTRRTRSRSPRSAGRGDRSGSGSAASSSPTRGTRSAPSPAPARQPTRSPRRRSCRWSCRWSCRCPPVLAGRAVARRRPAGGSRGGGAAGGCGRADERRVYVAVADLAQRGMYGPLPPGLARLEHGDHRLGGRAARLTAGQLAHHDSRCRGEREGFGHDVLDLADTSQIGPAAAGHDRGILHSITFFVAGIAVWFQG